MSHLSTPAASAPGKRYLSSSTLAGVLVTLVSANHPQPITHIPRVRTDGNPPSASTCFTSSFCQLPAANCQLSTANRKHSQRFVSTKSALAAFAFLSCILSSSSIASLFTAPSSLATPLSCIHIAAGLCLLLTQPFTTNCLGYISFSLFMGLLARSAADPFNSLSRRCASLHTAALFPSIRLADQIPLSAQQACPSKTLLVATCRHRLHSSESVGKKDPWRARQTRRTATGSALPTALPLSEKHGRAAPRTNSQQPFLTSHLFAFPHIHPAQPDKSQNRLPLATHGLAITLLLLLLAYLPLVLEVSRPRSRTATPSETRSRFAHITSDKLDPSSCYTAPHSVGLSLSRIPTDNLHQRVARHSI